MQVSGWRVTYRAIKEARGVFPVRCGNYRFFLSPYKNPEVVAPDGLHYALMPSGHNGVGACWSLYLGMDKVMVTDNLREETIDIHVASPEPWDTADGATNVCNANRRKILLLCH